MLLEDPSPNVEVLRPGKICSTQGPRRDIEANLRRKNGDANIIRIGCQDGSGEKEE